MTATGTTSLCCLVALPIMLGPWIVTGNRARIWQRRNELRIELSGEGSDDGGELDEDDFLIDELNNGSLALRGSRSGPSGRSGRRKSRSGRSGKRWRPDDRDGSPDTARQCFLAPSIALNRCLCAPMGV